MPSVSIVTGEWARGREAELIEAVQSAMVSAIKIPDWDRDVTVDLYEPTRRAVPTGKSERFTRVEVKLFSGRSIEAKRALYRAIVDNLAALGVPELETKIILVEVPSHNWGLRGGIPGSEIEIGFKVEV
ncbi:MAG TPA: tautomerase family protein [Rhodopseudomonas sp.]|uniref:tautomerase family protein n=1 Tax=Rhodopseudomonas sp. TaxID=1078 RepID=UPI002ED8D87A